MRSVERAKVPYNVYHYAGKKMPSTPCTLPPNSSARPIRCSKPSSPLATKPGPSLASSRATRSSISKKFARASGNKRVEMLHLKDLEKTTGYIRGGCSPIGMKKEYPTYVAPRSKRIDEILFSAGRRGTQMGLAVADFLSVTGAHVADITKDHD